ncbi:MAG: methyltransferase domain-containing protein [Undibacterium sp.]|nr:methyltransferase domain-containing protein [Opitutaceae bacterium]
MAIGTLERYLLLSLGLKSDACIVDIGCGSGRLACQLSSMKDVKYVGTDVVQELLDYAQQLTQRSDWKFSRVDRIAIPCADGVADFVCFFSVFTHLSHEDTYRYLAEAKRVLKPTGRIVFSFLEFRVPCHWAIFADSVEKSLTGLHLNQFMDRDGIQAWAVRLGLRVVSITSGDRPHIPISEEIMWDDGSVMKDLGNFGQSVAVLALAEDDAGAGAVPEAKVAHVETPSQETVSAPAARVLGFSNISSRGFAGVGENTMIVGFIVGPGGQKILARALGPSLKQASIQDFLQGPWMEVVNQKGQVVASNFGLFTATEDERAEICLASKALNASTLSDKDAALVAQLPEGGYSLLVRGHDSGTGVVLAEVFAVG